MLISTPGSPPRVRGKAIVQRKVALVVGITPAYAGKREQRRNRSPCNWDHPRVCGEKHAVLDFQQGIPGSPPRMRGKARFFGILCPGVGITPAYAGKSVGVRIIQLDIQDHPRVCGEKSRGITTRSRGLGSPPRVRGKESICRNGVIHFGITPACAGKRSCRSQPVCAR